MTDSRFKRGALIVAAIAALHGILYIPLVHRHSTTDTDAYVATARAIQQGSYTTPLRAGLYYTYPVGFFDLTGVKIPRSLFDAPERQAFRTPGYPLLLAAIGTGGPGFARHVALVVQALLLGLATWLLALTVRRWWSPEAGLAAAALYALDPYSKHYVTLVVTETLAALVAVACAYAFTRAWQGRGPWWWTATGALAAGLTLVRPVFVLLVPLVALAALVRALPRWRALAGVVAVAALLLGPWLAWTNHVTGRAVLTNWGEGFNLLLAAHGERLGHNAAEIERDPAFLRDFAAPRRLAPSPAELRSDPYAHPRYLERADRELRTRARELYRERLADEPLQVVWENAYRNYFLWSTHHDWYQPHGAALVLLQFVDWIVIVLALAGMAVAIAGGGASRWVAVYLLVYSVTLSTHHVEARFSIPLRGLFLAYVVLGASALVRKTQIQNGTVPVAPTE
jgi:4-amino-4-deoxy-L-arabinose transferase-like glycosyltransferase